MWKVLVKEGDVVSEGQLLCIIEAMKMENEITAHKAGKIVALPIEEGAPIQAGAPIATIVGEDELGSRAAATLRAWIARISRERRALGQLRALAPREPSARR